MPILNITMNNGFLPERFFSLSLSLSLFLSQQRYSSRCCPFTEASTYWADRLLFARSSVYSPNQSSTLESIYHPTHSSQSSFSDPVVSGTKLWYFIHSTIISLRLSISGDEHLLLLRYLTNMFELKNTSDIKK